MSNLLTYSFSAIKAFKECKYLYKLTYIDKKKPTEKPFAITLGDIVHRSIDQFFNSKDYSKENLYKIYNNIYDQEIKDEKFKNKKDDGIIFLDHYYKFDIIEKRINYSLNSEKSISADFDKYRLKGIIDRIYRFEDKYYILDFKTNKFMKVSSFQIYFYSFIYYKIYNVIADVIFLFLGSGKFIKYPVNLEKYNKIKEKIDRIHEEISSEIDFKPNYEHCKYCLLKNQCDLYKNPGNLKIL